MPIDLNEAASVLRLRGQLKFASGSLATYLNINYAQKMPASEGNEPDDIENKLYKVLPAGASRPVPLLSNL